MQEFIQMAAQQLGISQQQSTAATGGMLGLIQKSMGGSDFNGLLGQLPGASNLLGQVMGGGSAPAPSAPASGVGLGGMLGGLLGGGGGSSAGGIAGAVGGLLGGGSGGSSNPLGAVASLLGGSGGGGAASALSALGVLNSAGLSMDKIGPFVQMFLGYVQNNAGAGAQASIMNALPDLKKLLG
jgi:Protein of unknown function VcgC/VcgE (DUF2780)